MYTFFAIQLLLTLQESRSIFDPALQPLSVNTTPQINWVDNCHTNDEFDFLFFTQFQMLKILLWLKEVFQGEHWLKGTEANPTD